jgi:hypothetical protein
MKKENAELGWIFFVSRIYRKDTTFTADFSYLKWINTIIDIDSIC